MNIKKHGEMYNVFGMKNGNRVIVKTRMSALRSCNFIQRNEQQYCKKGFEYLIALPV